MKKTHESKAAEGYRTRAELLRILADEDREAETSAVLKSVAKRYDEMARLLDQIDRTNNSAGRP